MAQANLQYSIQAVLAEDEDGSLVQPDLSFEDIGIDRNVLGTSGMHEDENACVRLRLDLEVDVEKIVSTRTIGYRVDFISNLPNKQGSSFSNYFIDDFHEKVTTGERDFEAFQELVLEPRIEIITALDDIGDPSDSNNGIVDDSELNAFYENNMLLNTRDLISSQIQSSLNVGVAPTSMDKIFADLRPTYRIQKNDKSGTNSSNSPKMHTDGAINNPITLSEIRATEPVPESVQVFNSQAAASIYAAETQKRKQVSLGRVVKYTSSNFTSSRFFDIGLENISFMSNFTVNIFPIIDIETESGSPPAAAPYTISANISDDAVSEIFNFDGTKSQIKVTRNTPGKVSVEITRSDHFSGYFSVSLESTNPYTGITVDDEKEVAFAIGEYSKVVDFENVLNIDPFFTTISLLPKKMPDGPYVDGPPSVTIPGLPVNRQQGFNKSGIVENVKIGTSNTPSGINVELFDLPTNCSGVRIYRSLSTLLNERDLVFEGSVDREFSLIDENVSEGRTYVYQAELILRTPTVDLGSSIDYRWGTPSNEVLQESAKSRIVYYHKAENESIITRKYPRSAQFSVEMSNPDLNSVSNRVEILVQVKEDESAFSNKAVQALAAGYQKIRDLTNDPVFSQSNLHSQPVPFVKVTRLDLNKGGEPIVIGYGMFAEKSRIIDNSVSSIKEKTRLRYFAELSLVSLGSLRDAALELNSINSPGDRKISIKQKKYDVFSPDGTIETVAFNRTENNLIDLINRNMTGNETNANLNYSPPAPVNAGSGNAFFSPRFSAKLKYISKKWGADIQVDITGPKSVSEFMLYRKSSSGRKVLIAVQKVSKNSGKYVIKDEFLKLFINQKPSQYFLDVVLLDGTLLKNVASTPSEYVRKKGSKKISRKRTKIRILSSGKNTTAKIRKIKKKVKSVKKGVPIGKPRKKISKNKSSFRKIRKVILR